MLGPAIRRVFVALSFFVGITSAGAALIFLYGDGRYSLFESIYFAFISVTTVGFGELPNMDAHEEIRVITIFVIVFGVGAIAFFQSTLTTFLIEGYVGKAFRSRRMTKKIDGLTDHLVLAGCGRTGKYIVEELAAVRKDCVVIDSDEQSLTKVYEDLKGRFLYIVGDATDDHTLIAAGVERARGVVAALPDDRDNLFITLSARTMNPKARIVSKVVEVENEAKIMRAGADATVSPHRIGGLRLASVLVRPRVTEFLDRMLRVTKDLRFEEIEVPTDSIYVGKTLREVPIRQATNLLVVALHGAGGQYTYNPGPEAVLNEGIGLIVMGEIEGVEKLRTMFAEKTS